MYTCNNGRPHKHELAIEGRVCYGLISPPVQPRRQPATFEPPVTTRQLDYIRDLGGNLDRARSMTRKQASEYIDEIKKAATMAGTVLPSEAQSKLDKQKAMIAELIKSVPDGYFATQADEESKITFLRISRPKRNRYAGSIKIQTQHGPTLDIAAAVWPSGQMSVYKGGIIESLLLLMVDYQGCALRYAREIGRCCRCNAELTDDHSRHYGIGPECVKEWPWVVERVDERNAANA